MRKTKSRLFKLTLLFLGLMFLFIFKTQFSNFFGQKTPLVFPDLKTQSVQEITLFGEKTIFLYKKNNLWFVKEKKAEFPADQERIQTLINNLVNLKKEEIVSTNKTKHQNFGIGKEKISFKTKDKDLTIFIGKATSLNKTYLRINNQNEVFIGEGFNNAFNPDDYRDLLVHLINEEDKINQLEIDSDGKKIILEKKGNEWLINNKKAKKEKVDFFINDLKMLKADDILTKKINLPANYQLQIKLKEKNQEKSARFYPEEETNYFLKTSNSDLIYQLSAASVTSLKKEEKDFID